MVTLFSRITDLENHAAHAILTEGDDYATYRHRVGIANIFNPFRADVRYSLNLKVKDERSVAGKHTSQRTHTTVLFYDCWNFSSARAEQIASVSDSFAGRNDRRARRELDRGDVQRQSFRDGYSVGDGWSAHAWYSRAHVPDKPGHGQSLHAHTYGETVADAWAGAVAVSSHAIRQLLATPSTSFDRLVVAAVRCRRSYARLGRTGRRWMRCAVMVRMWEWETAGPHREERSSSTQPRTALDTMCDRDLFHIHSCTVQLGA